MVWHECKAAVRAVVFATIIADGALVTSHAAAGGPSSTPQSALAATRPSGEGFRLSIETPTPRIAATESLAVRISVRNVSAGALSFVERNPEWDFELEVLDSQGRTVAPTRYGAAFQDRQRQPISRRLLVDLKPGEQARYALWASRLVDLSVAGTYTIRVHQRVPRRDARGADRLRADVELISQGIQVVVTEPLGPPPPGDPGPAAGIEGQKGPKKR